MEPELNVISQGGGGIPHDYQKGDFTMSSEIRYMDLDFGTKPTPISRKEVYVLIPHNDMIGDFANAYYNELGRLNPTKLTTFSGKITTDTLSSYFRSLIMYRVWQVQGQLGSSWRVLKRMRIPSWIEFVMTMIGRATDPKTGFVLIPLTDIKIPETQQDPEGYASDKGVLTLKAMLEVSEYLSLFEVDGLLLHKDAFPRGEEGDLNFMSLAVLEEFVQGMNVSQPIYAYVAGFVGNHVLTENMEMFYRVRYEDRGYIRDNVSEFIK